MPKKKSNNLIFILLSIIIIAVVLLIISIVKLFIKPTETTLVKNGELTKYEEVVGYIIRDETLIDTSGYDGIIQTEIDDLNRVKSNGVIATYVSKSEETLMKKISALDEQIEEAMESQQTIYNSDAKALDANIQIQLYDNIKGNNNINDLQESKIKLNANIKKKAQIVGELSPAGSKLKELIDQRNNYEKQINDSKKELIAPSAGLVSYRVDGFENILTKKNISSLTSSDLKNLKLNTNQIIPRNTSKIKIVDNFECFISMYMDSPESKAANLNDQLYLRFENTGEMLIPATIEYISEEETGRLITVKIETNIEELTKYRKINLDVVWWSYSGLKLHKSLLMKREVTNLAGSVIATLDSVTIQRAGYKDVAYVKVLKEFGDYVIVDNYTDEEYIKMGFAEEDIANFVTLKMYNEVVIGKEER